MKRSFDTCSRTFGKQSGYKQDCKYNDTTKYTKEHRTKLNLKGNIFHIILKRKKFSKFLIAEIDKKVIYKLAYKALG